MSDSPIFPELEQLRVQLSLALGDAIWAFAKIESLTYDYLRVLSIEPLHELMEGQSFGARCALAKKLVNRVQGLNTEKNQALAAIKRAEELSKIRNRIAHNPWQIWLDFKNKDFQAGILHPVRPDFFELSLDDVRQFAIDTSKASGELKAALSALFEALRS